MKKQTYNQEINSLTEILRSKFLSTLTKRIELDDQIFTAAQQFANETLDFSYYPELEQIVNISKVQGIIKKIDVSQNSNLTELTFPHQKLTRLNLSNNKKLITLDVSNNQLAGLKLDQNSQLEYLSVADNEITGIWDVGKCSKIKFLNCQNNYLNELRVHKDLRYLLLSSDQNYLQPQKHDKARIHPLKNITYIAPLEGKNTDAKSNVQNKPPQTSKLRPS
jgi:Leucine-rich repeat (LRR) protein